MISKPLFKQSCKANAGIWAFVTFITCFMLAIIIFVLGNLNVNEIRSSMVDMFVSDAIESSVKEQSLTYFNMADTALSGYEENYNNLNNLLNVTFSNEQKSQITISYNSLILSGKTDQEAREIITTGKDEQTALAINTLITYYNACGNDYSTSKISEYVLNNTASALYNQLIEETDEETANTAKSFIEQAITKFVESGETDTTEFATKYIPTVLKDVFYSQEISYKDDVISVSKYFEKEQIEETSYNSILTYRSQMDIKQKQLQSQTPALSEEEIKTQLTSYSNSLITNSSKTLANQLPQKVTSSLNEIGDLDVYGLVIGSIFFKIAGLLLPMIFVIMTANNLIAGQVDSGSMAYVLSTPTKRRKVTITQMCYLVCSLLAMFALTSLTSVVCLAIVNSAEITITYGQILLLNLGAFITMLAISGICFLSSSWFNRSKNSMAFGGGLTMFFLVATILGLFGSSVIPSAIRIDAMKYFNFVSIISLFDAISILGNTTTFIWKLAILVGIAIITYTIGIFKFDKKDLPL